MSDRSTRILFVCLGNICRSPLAEGVFRAKAAERGVQHRFDVDSAGTSGYHVGASPDRRSAEVARARGVILDSQARQVTQEDLDAFDYVICMDSENLALVEQLRAAAGGRANVSRLREWDPEPEHGDVPDPYYGGPDGFERVHDIVDRACDAFLEHLLAEEQ